MVLDGADCNPGGGDAAGMGQGGIEVKEMTEAEEIRAFGENCKWLRKRIRELEEQLGIRQEEQRRMDREDAEVFRLVHGPKEPASEGCVHVVLR